MTLLKYFKNDLILLIIFKLTYVSLEGFNETSRENKIQQKEGAESASNAGTGPQDRIKCSLHGEQKDFDGAPVYSFFTFTAC